MVFENFLTHSSVCTHRLAFTKNKTLLPFTTQILLGFLGNSRDYGHNKEQFSNMCSETLVSRQRKVNKEKEEKKRPRKVGKKKEISNNPSITPIYYLIKIVTRNESFGPFFFITVSVQLRIALTIFFF